MPLRNRIFIIISIIALLILGIAVALLITRRAATQKSAANGNTTSTVQTGGGTGEVSVVAQNNTLPVQKLSSIEVQQVGVKQLARVFIERYYTYSSEGNFQNIRDVQTMVTPDLWNLMKVKLNTANISASGSFNSVTTVALGASLTDWADTAATVQVITHQSLDKNGAKSEQNQNYLVSFVKQGTSWLVNSIAVAK